MQQSCRSAVRSSRPAFGCRPCQAVPSRAISRAGRRSCVPVRASLTVKDSQSGVEFLLAQKFWQGEAYRCLGAATRSKKIVFVNVQVYSIAAYVEADRAAKELGVRHRGGFFETDDDYCSAITDGAFNKVLALHLVRDVTGEQFTDAINKTLLPRMQLAGDTASLDQFNTYFNSKNLVKDTEVLLMWSMAGDLEALVTPPVTSPKEYGEAKPELRIGSPALGRGLFEMFLGSSPVVPEARVEWVKGAKTLLESENVKRASRKTGGN